MDHCEPLTPSMPTEDVLSRCPRCQDEGPFTHAIAGLYEDSADLVIVCGKVECGQPFRCRKLPVGKITTLRPPLVGQ